MDLLMHITVLSLVSKECGVGRVFEIDENQTGAIFVGPRLRTDCNSILQLRVDNNVVRAANWKTTPNGGIGDSIESFWFLFVSDNKKFCEVENLNVMVDRFGPNNEGIASDTELFRQFSHDSIGQKVNSPLQLEGAAPVV